MRKSIYSGSNFKKGRSWIYLRPNTFQWTKTTRCLSKIKRLTDKLAAPLKNVASIDPFHYRSLIQTQDSIENIKIDKFLPIDEYDDYIYSFDN